MYRIDLRPSGYVLTFSGVINSDEMLRWKNESIRILSDEHRPSFGVIIDMKDLQPLAADTKDIMVSGQKHYKAKGMKRSAVLLNSTELASQFKNLAVISGIYLTERYIDASAKKNAIDLAISWVKDGIDPDK